MLDKELKKQLLETACRCVGDAIIHTNVSMDKHTEYIHAEKTISKFRELFSVDLNKIEPPEPPRQGPYSYAKL